MVGTSDKNLEDDLYNQTPDIRQKSYKFLRRCGKLAPGLDYLNLLRQVSQLILKITHLVPKSFNFLILFFVIWCKASCRLTNDPFRRRDIPILATITALLQNPYLRIPQSSLQVSDFVILVS